MGLSWRKINCHCSTSSDWSMVTGIRGRSWCVCSVFWLSKDSVPYLPLMEKLRPLGLYEMLIYWLTNYLAGRSQVVAVNGWVVWCSYFVWCPSGLCARSFAVSDIILMIYRVLFKAFWVTRTSICLLTTYFSIVLFQIFLTMLLCSWQCLRLKHGL